jgi:integrase
MVGRDAYTQTTIDALLTAKARPAGGQRIVTILGGMDLLVGSKGAGRWRYRYRPRGIDRETGVRYPQRSMTVGTTTTHSLREATAAVAALKLRVSMGQDPALADRAAAASARAEALALRRRDALAEAARITCRTKLEGYRDLLSSRGRGEKHQTQELAQVRLALISAELLDATPGEITTGHIERMMAACPAGSRGLRFGSVDRFLRWVCRAEGIAPATALFDRHERPKAPPPRQRVLTGAETASVWTAAAGLKERVLQSLVQFLVAIPCREGEAACATWADIDLPNRTWSQPTSKNGRPHRYPLNERAIAIIEARRVAVGANVNPTSLVFPAPLSGKVFGGWSNLKGSLDARIGSAVTPWRFHDLRRTAATMLGEMGYDDALVDMLLNHTAAGTRSLLTRTYNVSQRWEDRARAMDAWGNWIGTALGDPTPAGGSNVVNLPSPFRRIAS